MLDLSKNSLNFTIQNNQQMHNITIRLYFLNVANKYIVINYEVYFKLLTLKIFCIKNWSFHRNKNYFI